MEFMHIGTLWRRWISVLTLAYFAWREARRARHSLIVARENGHFVLRKSLQNSDTVIRQEPDAPDGDPVLAVLAAGAPIPAKVTHAARSSFVILELPADVVVVRRIAVPVRAREFLPGIIRNQIERLSPWHADQVVYGIDADVNTEDPASLDARVLIVLRSVIDEARDELAAMGLAVDRVVARRPPPSYPPQAGEGRAGAAAETPAPPQGRDRVSKPVALWSRLADISPENLAEPCRRVGLGIAAAVVLSIGLSLWAMTSAASLGGEGEEVAARITTLQRRIQGPRSVASLNPRERAWYAKETSPVAAIVFEALSRALPDSAYVTELRLEEATLRMIGLTTDAPSLIAPLEHSGHLIDVRFFAPTTRGPDGVLFRFNIEARVEPHFKIAEDEQ
jgi:general secretion pathway protein L